jgi:hypothetical protein
MIKAINHELNLNNYYYEVHRKYIEKNKRLIGKKL